MSELLKLKLEDASLDEIAELALRAIKPNASSKKNIDDKDLVLDNGNIEFKNIKFSYENSNDESLEKPTLKNISLNILWTPTPKLKHLMKRKSQAYTNGERITKKNIILYVIKLKPYTM